VADNVMVRSRRRRSEPSRSVESPTPAQKDEQPSRRPSGTTLASPANQGVGPGAHVPVSPDFFGGNSTYSSTVAGRRKASEFQLRENRISCNKPRLKTVISAGWYAARDLLRACRDYIERTSAGLRSRSWWGGNGRDDATNLTKCEQLLADARAGGRDSLGAPSNLPNYLHALARRS